MCRRYEQGNDKKIKWKLNLEISHEIDFDQRKLICFVYVVFVVAVDEHKKKKTKRRYKLTISDTLGDQKNKQ